MSWTMFLMVSDLLMRACVFLSVICLMMGVCFVTMFRFWVRVWIFVWRGVVLGL